MTVAMQRVTTNYLEGEQRVCDSWANHINSSRMTLEQAVDFARSSLTRSENMAHVLVPDGNGGLTGLSTAPKSLDAADYTVSYANLDLLEGWEYNGEASAEGVNIGPTPTPPTACSPSPSTTG